MNELDLLKVKIEKESAIIKPQEKTKEEKVVSISKSAEYAKVKTRKSHGKILNRARLHILIFLSIFALSTLFLSQLDATITGYTVYSETAYGDGDLSNNYSFVYSGTSLIILLGIILFSIRENKKKLEQKD